MSTTTSFVRKLASNDKLVREKSLEALKKFLKSRSSAQLSLLEMEKLWRGLYFLMWYCDKSGPQEALAEDLGSLYSETIALDRLSTFHEAFWAIMVKEWPGIDQWRMDKYYMLIRRILRHNLKRLQALNWDEDLVDSYLAVLEKYPLNGQQSMVMALPYHLCDIYIDELETALFDGLDDDCETEEEEEALRQKKVELASKAPVEKLVSSFAKIVQTSLVKTLKKKCKEDVLEEERLVSWGIKILVAKNGKEKTAVCDEEDSDKEDEWKGF